MFDAGLFEMLVIFTLGLLVLGPERLPQVARFVGRWIGQARRAVSRLNNEIERELALEEIRRFQKESDEQLRAGEQAYREGLGAIADDVRGRSQTGAGAGAGATDHDGAGRREGHDAPTTEDEDTRHADTGGEGEGARSDAGGRTRDTAGR